jgi:hypothetical protein
MHGIVHSDHVQLPSANHALNHGNVRLAAHLMFGDARLGQVHCLDGNHLLRHFVLRKPYFTEASLCAACVGKGMPADSVEVGGHSHAAAPMHIMDNMQ